jgi:hypothetical protein
MDAIYLTKKQYERLKRLELGKEITSTECKMHIIPSKNGWCYESKLLKEFYINEGRTFGNKLNTINTLIDEGNRIGISELVLPERLAIVDDKVIGFTMPYICNTNLYYKLIDYHTPIEAKVRYLKEVGKILEKIKNARDYGLIDKFFLGDIHEQNFIVNSQTDKVMVVDLDSAYIGKNNPFPAKYLSTNKAIMELPKKYPSKEGLHVPNQNSDILCYYIMILNFISKFQTNKLDISDYYIYLDYLRQIGFPSEILSLLSKAYLNVDNINPYFLLDKIADVDPKIISFSNYRAHQFSINKK